MPFFAVSGDTRAEANKNLACLLSPGTLQFYFLLFGRACSWIVVCSCLCSGLLAGQQQYPELRVGLHWRPMGQPRVSSDRAFNFLLNPGLTLTAAVVQCACGQLQAVDGHHAHVLRCADLPARRLVRQHSLTLASTWL